MVVAAANLRLELTVSYSMGRLLTPTSQGQHLRVSDRQNVSLIVGQLLLPAAPWAFEQGGLGCVASWPGENPVSSNTACNYNRGRLQAQSCEQIMLGLEKRKLMIYVISLYP